MGQEFEKQSAGLNCTWSGEKESNTAVDWTIKGKKKNSQTRERENIFGFTYAGGEKPMM